MLVKRAPGAYLLTGGFTRPPKTVNAITHPQKTVNVIIHTCPNLTFNWISNQISYETTGVMADPWANRI